MSKSTTRPPVTIDAVATRKAYLMAKALAFAIDHAQDGYCLQEKAEGAEMITLLHEIADGHLRRKVANDVHQRNARRPNLNAMPSLPDDYSPQVAAMQRARELAAMQPAEAAKLEALHVKIMAMVS